VSENVLHAADVVLVPIIPTVLARRTYDQLRTFLGTLHGPPPAVHAFFSMVDRRKRLHREIMDEVVGSEAGGDVGAAAVPAWSAIERMSVHRAPLPSYAPRSAAATAYRDLWDELAARLEI
jgi:cellulose biosynthesis protein BcsQ